MIEHIKNLNKLQEISKELIKRLDNKIKEFNGPIESKDNIIKIVETVKKYLNNLLILDINLNIKNNDLKEELEQIYYNKRQEIIDLKQFITNKEYKYNLLKTDDINIKSELTMLYIWGLIHQNDTEPITTNGVSLDMLKHYLNINIELTEVNLKEYFENNKELYKKIKYDIETNKYYRLFTEEDYKNILELKEIKPLSIESPFTYENPGEECELISKTFSNLSNLIGFKLYERRIPLTREDLVKEFNFEYKVEQLILIPTLKNVNEIELSTKWKEQVDTLINTLEDINKMIKTIIKSKSKEDKISLAYRSKVEEYINKDELFNILKSYKGISPTELEQLNENKYKSAYQTLSTLINLTNEDITNLLGENPLEYIKNNLDNNELLITWLEENTLKSNIENKLNIISMMGMLIDTRDITKEAAINIIYKEFYPIINDML